jgi:hypothetical protein
MSAGGPSQEVASHRPTDFGRLEGFVVCILRTLCRVIEERDVLGKSIGVCSGVAGCWVAPDCKHLYASSDGLGQAFSFDIMMYNFNAREYRHCVEHPLKTSRESKSSTTWVLSNHDVSFPRGSLPGCPSSYAFWNPRLPKHELSVQGVKNLVSLNMAIYPIP